MVPPSDRCRYKTDKLPTGPYDRKKLLQFLEKKAREDKDWEEVKPYIKEIRGLVVHSAPNALSCMVDRLENFT